MVFRFSFPYTTSRNSKAERMIRTINNVVRTLLIQASLPPSFWVYALATMASLLNIFPTKAIQKKTPTNVLY